MSFRFIATLSTLILAVALGGCHTAKVLIPPNLRPPAQDAAGALKAARQHLQQATPCCSSFADFSYQATLPWQPTRFTVGSGSTVANLDGTHT